MLDRIDQTIVAVSSAPGRSPVGIVRLSGPDAFCIADGMIRSDPGSSLRNVPGYSRRKVEIEPEPGARVPAMVYVFRGPRSYTRQDVVEFYTIGSPPLLEWLCDAAIERGAVRAAPGEFTARAYLLGAMDLGTAEAVAGVIRAESDVQLRAARRMADGVLQVRMAGLLDRLGDLLALVEAGIDFADEPIEFIAPSELAGRLGAVHAELSYLSRQSVSVEGLNALPHVLLLGPPNAGKSSLMNRLSGTDRAICSAVAGTTRDLLSAPVRLGAVEAILLDSAGVDESADEVLEAARAMTRAAARSVDLVCLVLDITAATGESTAFLLPRDSPPAVVVLNKCDLVGHAQRSEMERAVTSRLSLPVCTISAVDGTGLDRLGEVLTSRLGESAMTVGREALFMSRRQAAAISSAAEALNRAGQLLADGESTGDRADLLAFEMRDALDHLGTVCGSVTTEDLLSRVFSQFCIGK